MDKMNKMNKINKKNDPIQEKKRKYRFAPWMQKKLLILVVIIFISFVGLTVQLIRINRESGEKYKKQVLSQQKYDSTVIPYRRGEILDSRGTTLAVSEKVYNVILDARAVLEKKEYQEPTLTALSSQFGAEISDTSRAYLKTNPSSQYYVLAKRLSFEEIEGFKKLQADQENGKNIQGVWFEEEYKRYYPNNTLASDLVGFTTSDNNGLYGLEKYYNDILIGTAGREYGYLNGDAELERTTIAAVDGDSIVTTIDANIQGIAEKYLKKFNEENKDKVREGNGALNVGCIIMEVNTGNILAMASYPNFDLNETKNTDALLGMQMVDAEGKKVLPATYINAENLAAMDDTTLSQNFNSLWKNYCISDTYEPGSVVKPFTVATALESGKITGNETYNCEGYLEVGGHKISCHQTFGDGLLTVAQGVERSCNVCMMHVAAATGKDIFVDFQHTFNFGLKTNVDLEGEARTVGLVYGKDNMRSAELATCSFGQGFNTTMVQVITAFCSLVNGGNYYEPHIVKEIVSPTGATVRNFEPRLLKQTISPETSRIIKEYCNLVVTGEHGTGHTARPAGYMIGGKTGTAETIGGETGFDRTISRDHENYVVSFLGYAPADNPEIAVYVVVDRPNAAEQDDAKFATRIVKNIFTEVLPYLKIYMTEELTDKEREELAALQAEILLPIAPAAGGGSTDEAGAGESGDPSGSDTATDGSSDGDTATGGAAGDNNGSADSSGANNPDGNTDDAESGNASDNTAENQSGGSSGEGDGETQPSQVWKQFPIDPNTGYAVDPDTGESYDPVTGTQIGGSFEMGGGSILPPADAPDPDVPL